MANLGSIFGRAKMTYRGAPETPPIIECCVNRKLMPRWRGPQVMEDDSLAMGFVCHACGREFLPNDVRNRRLIRAGEPRPAPAPVAVAAADEESAAEEAASDVVASEGDEESEQT